MATMLVRQADLDSDYGELIRTLQTNLPLLPPARFFDWLYRRNPEGPALTWIAIEAESGKTVGVAAAFPRRLYWRSAEVRGYVLGDFCIAPEHRSLGLAVALQRACLAELCASGARFALDFPSEGMLAVYKRLRIPTDRAIVRHARLLRADQKVGSIVRVGAVARGITVVANGALRLANTGRRRTRCAVELEEWAWGEEFTLAARRWSGEMGTCVARTSEYLNWRYGEHPSRRYQLLAARSGTELRGYLVQHMDGINCTIDDLMADDDAVRHDLLLESIATAGACGGQTLSAPWLSTNPGGEVLREFGFWRRESRPLVLLSWNADENDAIQGEECWYVSHGDWES
jgi:hypothetical protein